MPKYKATAYIRLSYTDDHSSESDSVSNQRKLIENFVERNPDIEVVSEKIDDGYSGIIFDRPAFKEMMQDVTDGNINCVIVKRPLPLRARVHRNRPVSAPGIPGLRGAFHRYHRQHRHRPRQRR